MSEPATQLPVPGEEASRRTPAAPAAPAAVGPRAGRRRAGTAAALALAIFAVSLVELYPTFRLSYAYDDLDCLNLAADVMAGKLGYWQVAFWPHNEHLMPLMRMAFHASAAWFGIN
ncbi:MAG: hypothetical protein JOZ15_06940, partial [Acidobacteria bacterium]|nr:hypothetical protein [Acidobacteriota bacterium]